MQPHNQYPNRESNPYLHCCKQDCKFFAGINAIGQGEQDRATPTIKPTVPQPLKPVEEQNKKRDAELAETIQTNSTAFNLVSKQLSSLTEAIESLKKKENTDDLEIEIQENAEFNERIRLASESFLYEKLKDNLAQE